MGGWTDKKVVDSLKAFNDVACYIAVM